MRRVSIPLLLYCLAMGTGTVAQQRADPAEKPLDGVIDIHLHLLPDVVPRSIDAFDMARLARDKGMRAIVMKNHYEGTAAQAYLVRKAVPGIEVFGGIALNLSSGGMNPYAVERMAQMTGGYGRIVWMDSFDSEEQVRMEKQPRPFVAVSKNGELLPETKAVIGMIAKYHLAMSTGHNTPEEDLMLISEAKRQGVEQIVVTHAMMKPIHMSIPQMQQAAALGAYIEFAYNGTIGKAKEFEVADYVRAIRAVGTEHCILSTDLGQPDNPNPVDGWIEYLAKLKMLRLTQKEIDVMSKKNPARVLGLN
jgi:hypothetical protein